jgi:DNA-binding PadR family transcriptional regulator
MPYERPVPWKTGNYDPRDEYPVLDKLKAAGWISRYWSDRQDLYAEWTELGRERMQNWSVHAEELQLDSDNQGRVMEFYSRYLIGPPSEA